MNFVVRDQAGLTLQALFQSSGVDGVRARTQLFERAVEGLTGLISRLRDPDTEVLRFPPVTTARGGWSVSAVDTRNPSARRSRSSRGCSPATNARSSKLVVKASLPGSSPPESSRLSGSGVRCTEPGSSPRASPTPSRRCDPPRGPGDHIASVVRSSTSKPALRST